MLRHSAAYFAARAASGTLALLTIYLLTRVLTSDQFGRYALGMAAINITSAVAFQAIALATARFVPAATAPGGVGIAPLTGEAWRLFAWSAAGILTLAAAAAGVSSWLSGDRGWIAMIVVMALGAVTLGIHNLNLQVANARGEPARFGVLAATRLALSLAASLLLVAWGFGAEGALVGTVIGGLVSVAFLGVARPWNIGATRDPALRRQLLDYAAPMVLTYAAGMTVDVADRFLIGAFHGASAVSGYAAAYDLAQQTISVALNIFFLAVYPKIVLALEQEGVHAASRVGKRLGHVLVWIAPYVLATFVGLTPDISRFMFGAGIQADAALLLPWIALATTLVAIRSFWFDIAFVATRDTGFMWRNSLWVAAVNIGLNLLWMPSMGPIGSAYAAIASAAVGGLRSWWYGRRIGLLAPVRREASHGFLAGVSMATMLLVTSMLPDATQWYGSVLRWLGASFLFLAWAWIANGAGLREWVRTRQAARRRS